MRIRHRDDTALIRLHGGGGRGDRARGREYTARLGHGRRKQGRKDGAHAYCWRGKAGLSVGQRREGGKENKGRTATGRPRPMRFSFSPPSASWPDREADPAPAKAEAKRGPALTRMLTFCIRGASGLGSWRCSSGRKEHRWRTSLRRCERLGTTNAPQAHPAPPELSRRTHPLNPDTAGRFTHDRPVAAVHQQQWH